MKDLNEGLTPEGIIKTGVRRDRIVPVFEPVISEVLEEIKSAEESLNLNPVSIYIYGSVATGTAVSPSSDIDFLTIGMPSDVTQQISSTLSDKFEPVCRGVEIAPANYTDFQGESDASYGGRVFLRHYCLHLYGYDVVDQKCLFPGDAKAARGFNGDIGMCYQKWREEISQSNPSQLGRRIARKTLLAVAGLVSIHDHIWTTDRNSSAMRWSDLNPQWRSIFEKFIAWSEGIETASLSEVAEALSSNGAVDQVVQDFQMKIGLSA